MPVKPASENNIIEQVQVTEISQNDSNFKAVQAISTKTVSEKQFEDFIESSEFLGDNSLFVKYSFVSDENEVFDTATSQVSSEIAESFDTPPDINIPKGRDFNFEFVDNFLALAEQNLTTEEFTEFMLSLPNQVKSLFMYQLDFVKTLTNVPAGDLVSNLKTQASINVNHFKLVRVEIFDGYEMSQEGEMMINKPKFRLLKREDVDSLTSTTMCRLKAYSDNNLKINRDMLSFPVEGQHFFIQPENSIVEPPSVDKQQQEAKNITIQHFVAKDYDLVGSTSNIVVQPEGVSFTRSNGGSGGIVEAPPAVPNGTTTAPATVPTTGGGY